MEIVKGDDCFRMLDLEPYIIFYFGAEEWCGPCKEAGPKYEELSKEYDQNNIRFFKVSLDDQENKEFIHICDVRVIPTFILFKNRTFIDRIQGVDFDSLKNLIDRNINKVAPSNKDDINRNVTISSEYLNVMQERAIEARKKAEEKKKQEEEERKRKEEEEEFYQNDTFQGEYEGYVYKTGDRGTGYYKDRSHLIPSNGGIEVHMVYGSWCGHSKNALPAFEELVQMKDVTTQGGLPVQFVLTEDTSDGMEKFKSKVQGFPTYMVIKKDGIIEELTGHNRTKDSIIEAVNKLSY
tara:strand:+ start:3733 stop:4614 length:882 start_codon:yes stop_codon:yes gene_type:complete